MSARTRGTLRDRRRTYWLWIDHAVIDNYAAKIGPHALSVYVYLVRKANEEDAAWPSIKTIATVLGIGRSTAKRAIETLTAHELIGCEQRTDEDGDPASNLYTILDVPKEAASPDSSSEGGRSTQNPPQSTQNPGVGPHRTGGRSTQNHEEEPGKNNQIEEEGARETSPVVQRCVQLLASTKGHSKSKDELTDLVEELSAEIVAADPEQACRDLEFNVRHGSDKVKVLPTKLRTYFRKDAEKRPVPSANGKKLHAEGEVWTENGKTFKKVGGEKFEVLN